MARKAVEFSDSYIDIWHAVNSVSIEPTDGKHGDELVGSYQTVVVAQKRFIGGKRQNEWIRVIFLSSWLAYRKVFGVSLQIIWEVLS